MKKQTKKKTKKRKRKKKTEPAAEMIASLRAEMTAQGVTQRAMAAAADMPQPLVCAYLTGAKMPGAANLARMAATLGCRFELSKLPF